jgi:NADH-quinone oxidoreductase subunit J
MNSPVSVIVFYGFSAVLIALSLITVLSRNVFRSALALTGALAVVAGLFALMASDFLAAAQLLIYVGGIMIIMLFVVLLSQAPLDKLQRQINSQGLLGALAALAVAATFLIRFRDAFRSVNAVIVEQPTTAPIGRLLLNDYLVPFEVVSLVLLAALVGAVLFLQDQGHNGQGDRR